MADVFVSYARSDAKDAAVTATALRKGGSTVWNDEQLPAHRAYADVISTELEKARAVLVLWSKAATESHWVRSEANRARELGKLVQARLDDARLPMPFDQIQCADLRGWRRSPAHPGFQTLLGSIADLTGGELQPIAEPRSTSRRALLIGGGAAALVAGAGVLAWREARSPEMPPEAQLLLQKGLDALQANDALDPEDEGSTAQAIALLTEATRVAPDSATAWGGLALAYAVRRRSAPVADRQGLETRGRAAATAGLRLDPEEPRALAAKVLMEPVYGHWLQAERAARTAHAKNPDFPILLFVLSDVLGSVGRWREAAQLSSRLDRTRFLIPGADRKVIINLWAAGDLQGADEALKAAAERWPDQRQVWRTRIAYLMYSGRASEAAAILNDTATHPVDVVPENLDWAIATARALAGQTSRAEGLEANLRHLKAYPERAMPVAQAVAALGGPSAVLPLLNGYYFGEGDWAALAPPAGDQDRLTGPMFQPPMRSLWNQPEFDRLLTRIGLARYWQESGTLPDYRRPS